ncbi:MAG: citramalate synthase [Parvibaculum sp.]|nr:citramalate synthase [Parvibaculum sp.]|tara:strand:- start:647 stop:2281 length:1635 start_codon:yes stop_codon:yes gene_type:complete
MSKSDPKTRLYLFDTTLRDGAQTQGVDFSVEDKRLITGLLDELGLDYIEGGYPGANPTDTSFFSERPKLKQAKFTAFGMTKRAGRSASNDPGLAQILDADTDAVCLVAKSWDFHVRVALGVTNEENLESIEDSVKAIAARGREPMIDCEHFFDGYKANPAYALACVRTALDAGARWAVLCDTNGGTMPHEVARIVGEVIATGITGDKLGIHAHNDTENAVANTLAAVHAGVRQVQGTLNGLGERCGNANMSSLIPTFLLKPEFADRFEIGVSLTQLKSLTHVSRTLDELLNRAPDRYAPYVGENAFFSKAGIHVSAILKDPSTYEHVPPEATGNARKIAVSEQAGRSNILIKLEEAGITIDPKDTRIQRLLDDVKDREFLGYSYDGAGASFELLARRLLGQVPEFFTVESFRVLVERRYNAAGDMVTVSEATVKVNADGEVLISVGEGNGPVNALDQALRKDLGKYSPYIEDLTLVDYKVRILTSGTEAVTRVMIESRDGKGNRWFTVGVSENIVDASFQALVDSITYKLLRDGAPARKAAAKF